MAKGTLSLFLALASLPAWGQTSARALYWRALDVEARLDSDGALHVRERQAMVFTGDWNGGERAFRLAWNHELELTGIEREDPRSHSRIPLSEGDLSRVDRYSWHDATTLRWRSRLPSDPPFQETEIVYVLDYTLRNILVPEDDGSFRLDHDFAFPDREGAILAYSLRLSFDPVWSPPERFSGEIRRSRLVPGESVVLTLPLEYRGSGAPASVRFGAPLGARVVAAAVFLAGFAAAGFFFYREEDSLGRFRPLVPRESIDEPWLDENVFSMLPEEVGAAWDETTGAPEVAAVVARMVSEKKLASEVYRKKKWLGSEENLRLKLLVDRERLSGYEKSLVKALFVSGDETDTEKIRKHYQKRGFDPAARLKGPLAKRVKALLRNARMQRTVSRKPALALLTTSAVSLVIGFGDLPSVTAPMGLALVAYLAGLVPAVLYRKRVERLFAFALTFIAPAAVIAASALFILAVNPYRCGFFALAALSGFDLALLWSLLNMAKFRDGLIALELRRTLASARRYFEFELEKPSPRLKDAWFPYLLAFELGPDVDRWFRVHGASSDGGLRDGTSSSSTGPPSSGSTSWTGGGGDFGGAGATGSWAAAVGSVTAGVAAPSEGGSGGGSGGGGGGSSGGGGGGGW